MNAAHRPESEAQAERLACTDPCSMQVVRIHALSVGDEVTLRCRDCGDEKTERRHRGVVVS